MLPLEFEKEVETKRGVPGYRFTPNLDVFASVERNPENACFCPSGPPCAPNGLFNVSLCQYGKRVHSSLLFVEPLIILFFSRLSNSAKFPAFLPGR